MWYIIYTWGLLESSSTIPPKKKVVQPISIKLHQVKDIYVFLLFFKHFAQKVEIETCLPAFQLSEKGL